MAIGDFQLDSFKVSAMNLEHVTSGLKRLGVKEEIDGIIGADLLEKGNAVINYPSKQLFLKKNQPWVVIFRPTGGWCENFFHPCISAG